MQLPLRKVLKTGLSVELDAMRPEEQQAVRALLNTVICEGQTYPQDHELSETEFLAYWMSHAAFVVRTVEPISSVENSPASRVVGAFYLKPNFPGRGSHICNAGFIVQPEFRAQGIGRWMGESMLAIAVAQGYSAVMFNLVFATNQPSINLWRSLGFSTIGQIPNAVRFANNQAVDALILYRSLV